MKALNLNQEFPKDRSKGCPMPGVRAVRCLPTALALAGRVGIRVGFVGEGGL
jgi:hypothetical protein